MKIIIYEDMLHDKELFPQTKQFLEGMGIQNERARIRIQLERILNQGETSWVIIHHRNFEEVALLKKNFPEIKFAGYSGFVSAEQKGLNLWLTEEMKKNYDDILGDSGYAGRFIIPNYNDLHRIIGDKK